MNFKVTNGLCCSLHPQVDVALNAAVWDKISWGEYRPNANDQPEPLEYYDNIISPISEVWPNPPHGHLHVFVALPGGMGGSLWTAGLHQVHAVVRNLWGRLYSSHRPPNMIDPHSSTSSQPQSLLPLPCEYYSYLYSLHSHWHQRAYPCEPIRSQHYTKSSRNILLFWYCHGVEYS